MTAGGLYVRWERRPRSKRMQRREHQDEAFLMVAKLVVSYRDKLAGGPRQHVWGYLGSIPQWAISYTLRRGRFWDDALRRLGRWGGLSDAERARVLAGLERVVPRPDPVELAQERASFARFTETLRAFVPPGRRRSTHKCIAGDAFVGTTRAGEGEGR